MWKYIRYDHIIGFIMFLVLAGFLVSISIATAVMSKEILDQAKQVELQVDNYNTQLQAIDEEITQGMIAGENTVTDQFIMEP